MKPEFEQMNLKDLEVYVLSHFEDQEAFYTFIDRCKASKSNSIVYPSPTTPEGQALTEKAIRERLGIQDDDKKNE